MVNPVRKFGRSLNFIKFKLPSRKGVFSNGVKRFFLAVLFLLSAAGFLSAAQPMIPDKTSEIAQDFTLEDSGGNRVSLSDFKGKPVILFFWTISCPHCSGELKMLNEANERIRKDGVELLAVNAGERPAKVGSFTKSSRFAFKVLLDEDTLVSQLYDIVGVPTYIFIDKGGNIVYRKHHFEEKKYNRLISQ